MATLLVMRSLLAARDPFADAKDTLSSWDKCMAKSYCKWPVIVAIVVGGLIVLSTVFCIARCLCCGAELACCCFKCCTCCCSSGGRSGHKRVKTPPPRPYDASAYGGGGPAATPSMDSRPLNQQYRSHPTPGFNPQQNPKFASAPSRPAFNSAPKAEAPEFARFDAHAKPANEDSLPVMPSWKDARSVQVEEEVIPEKRDDVEMDRLDPNGNLSGTSMAAVAAGGAGAARRSPGQGRSPLQRLQMDDGQSSIYSDDSRGYSGGYGQQPAAYRGLSPIPPLSPTYGAGAGYAQTSPYDRRSPGPGYNGPVTRRSPGPGYDQYSQPQQYNQSNPARSPPPLNTNNSYGYGNSNQYHDNMDVSPVLGSANGMYNNNTHNNYSSAPAPIRDPSPVYAAAHNNYSPTGPLVRDASPLYAPSGSTSFEPPTSSTPAPAYPGQQTYGSSDAPAFPGQNPYQAYTPVQGQAPQYPGVGRKPLEGSWKEI